MTDKNIYNVNLSDKIRKSVASAKEFKLDLDSNVNDIKKKAGELSRKEINLSFIDRFTRKIYVNENRLLKLELLQYIFFIIIIYYYNPFNISTTFPAFTKVLVLTVSFLYVVLFFFIRTKVNVAEDIDLINPTESNIIVEFISTILMFVVFMLVIKCIIWLLMHTSIINSIYHMMTIFIIVGVLGIVYLFMRNKINKAKNAPGRKFTTLLLKIVMYLPCLLVEFVEYVKYEFHLTTKPVWILIGLEGIFVAIVFLLPIIIDKMLTSDGLKLLNSPVNLNNEYTIGAYENLYKHTKNDKREKEVTKDEFKADDNNFDQTQDEHYKDPNIPKNKYFAWIYNKIKNPGWIKVDFNIHPQYTDTGLQKFRYKYALSGWFNINPQPSNTGSAYGKYTNILNYGKKVSLEYNGKLNSLRVMAEVASKSKDRLEKNQIVQVFETKNIIYQKWNNIVINYDKGYIDVFLNGDLVASISGVAPYMAFDSITAGAKNGIFGGICNVTYYQNVLSKRTIVMNYKSLRSKDEPYIWKLTDDINVNIERKTNVENRFLNDIKNKLEGRK